MSNPPRALEAVAGNHIDAPWGSWLRASGVSRRGVRDAARTRSARLSRSMRSTKAASPPAQVISAAVPEKAVPGFCPASSRRSKKGGLHMVNVKRSPSRIAGGRMGPAHFRVFRVRFRVGNQELGPPVPHASPTLPH